MATKAKREEIRDILLKLDSEGRLLADVVIDEARNPESPLHDQFTWDVDKAARQTWLREARELISSFHVSLTVRRTEYRVQEFVERPDKRSDHQGYTSIANIKSNKDLARDFLARELAVASTYVSKCQDFGEVLGLRDRVTGLADDIADLIVEARGSQAAPYDEVKQ